MTETAREWLHFLKGRRFTIATHQEEVSVMFDQMNRGKILNAQTKFSRGLELSQLLYDTRCIPGIYYDYLMRCLERVPLHPVCLFANCTNHSAILDTHGFTTFFGNAICLTPARRRRLPVDRTELALDLSRVLLIHLL